MCFVLGKDSTDSVRWWIDASYAVHPNMRGHTGATMSMGNGSVFSGSWKQKMVTITSTESEVIAIYDVLPQILWTKKFLEDQGVTIKDPVLYQDNMSSMLLKWNGRQSSTKRTKYMDIWYFYVGDHIQNKTLSLQHCPTDEMLADFFAKPLQGSLFIRLRNHIMGTEFEDGDPKTHRSVLEDQDDYENQGASERDQGASEQDQEASERDQNDENVCGVGTARDQSDENVCSAGTARVQNDENVCGASTHQDEDTSKNEKQITYLEALLRIR